MTDVILNVRDLKMYFQSGGGLFGKAKNTVKAVDNVTFSVSRGETFGVVGESGSGKTTLGRCIMRVLKPTEGAITFYRRDKPATELAGEDTEHLRDIWRDLRMVFQDPQSSLNPRLRVLEIVGQSLRKSENLKGKELAERVSTLLEQVGLRREFLMRYPNAFSGGQRQRLGIARALATAPELVVADEAVSALDVSIQAQTLNLLQDLQEQFKLTYIFIAHDLAVVEHICDRIAVMYLGEIVELADTEALFDSPKHPYTRALLSAVPVPDPRARNRKRISAVPAEIGPITAGCRFAARCSHKTAICTSAPPPRIQIGGTQVLCHHAEKI